MTTTDPVVPISPLTVGKFIFVNLEICCISISNVNFTGRTRGIFLPPTSTPSDNKNLVSKIKSQLESAQETGRFKFQSMKDTEDRLVTNNIVVLPGSSSALISLVFHTTQESQKINFGALMHVYTSEDIVKKYICN